MKRGFIVCLLFIFTKVFAFEDFLTPMIKEWNFVRAIACLSILFLHTSTWYFYNSRPAYDTEAYIRILLCYATPTFIILSFIALFYAYRNTVGIPKNFLKKRLYFIVLPFVFWALIDAFVSVYLTGNYYLLLSVFQNNVLKGSFVGWFVLVILQFYLIYLVAKPLKIHPIILLIAGTLISLQHEWLWENTTILSEELNRILFTRWAIFFGFGAMIGHYYDTIRIFIKKYIWLMLLGTLACALVIFVDLEATKNQIHSRRPDLILLVIFFSLFLMALGQYLPRLRFIDLVSKYSFMIYFMHFSILRLLAPPVADKVSEPYIAMGILAFIALFLPISIAKLISLIPYSRFIVGKFGK